MLKMDNRTWQNYKNSPVTKRKTEGSWLKKINSLALEPTSKDDQ